MRPLCNELWCIVLPVGIFGQKPQGVTKDPAFFLERLETFDLNDNMLDLMWEYYFKLNEVFYDVSKDAGKRKNCQIGPVSCSPPKEVGRPDTHSGTVLTETPAGTWTSQLLADSENGGYYMCHTLVPNVTVDFSMEDGNAIAFKWNRDDFKCIYQSFGLSLYMISMSRFFCSHMPLSLCQR